MKINLQEICKVNDEFTEDNFVGIRTLSNSKDNLEIRFPLGFNLSKDEAGIKKDVKLLILTLLKYKKLESSFSNAALQESDFLSSPIQDYLYLIQYYFDNNGRYYQETDIEYTKGLQGKINWSKTIKIIKPMLQDNSLIFTNFVVKRNFILEDQLITQIHKYCTQLSFERLGWLFCDFIPPSSDLDFSNVIEMCIATITNKLHHTFKDKDIELFQSLLSVLKDQSSNNINKSHSFGIKRFEYVWEKMIDNVFGNVSNKSKYFPKATWHIRGKIEYKASLEPDTILKVEDDIFVIDAKYYKYGITKQLRINSLPGSSDINKQITYGKYIKENFRVDPYNMFLIPFNKDDNLLETQDILYILGFASGTWINKEDSTRYSKVYGVLVDSKSLMDAFTSNDKTLRESLINKVCFSNHIIIKS